MRNRKQFTFGIAVLTVILISIAAMVIGCSSPSIDDNNAAQTYGQTIEVMLKAINDNDYAKFSADFNAQMKTSLTETSFNELTDTIKSKIDTYVASQVYAFEEQSGYEVVTYKAKFTGEPEEVTVTVKFQKAGGKSLVSYFNLDSPKLQSR
jgi:hypothetical protein